jgi:hypothetical protein
MHIGSCTVFLLLLLNLAGGCSGNRVTNEVATKNDSNLKRLVNLYAGYQLTHNWQGPKNEIELKEFVKHHGLPEKNLQMMGIDSTDPDAIFTSERDGKPFKIKYRVAGGIGSVTPIVFEQTGRNGMRLVGFTTPIVEEVADARYRELWEKGGLPTGTTPTNLGARPDNPQLGPGPLSNMPVSNK